MSQHYTVGRGKKLVSLKVSAGMHFLAKCAALYQGVTLDQIYQQALRYYLVRECKHAVRPLISEFVPPLTPEEKEELLSKN